MTRSTRFPIALICAAISTFAGHVFAAEIIWWEGENHVATNFREHPWVKMQPAERQGLSGGDWLTHMHKPQFEKPAGGYYFARYKVQVPQSSRYHLWSRQWADARVPGQWRFDDQPWREAGPDLPRENNVGIAPDRTATWYRYGEVELNAGGHTFAIRLSAQQGIAAYDCFLLYRGRFQPAGSRKPQSDAAEFYQYLEQERVENILKARKAEIAAIEKVRENAAKSRDVNVDFMYVGREVDVVPFGIIYAKEMAAHNVKFEEGFPYRENASFGEHGWVEWDMTAPEAGSYVLTFSSDASRPYRTHRLHVKLRGQWNPFGIMDTGDEYHAPLELPAGVTRFRVAASPPKGGGYFSGARLSRPRGNPWQGAKPGVHPRLLFTAEEITKIGKALAGDADHPARNYYVSLVNQAQARLHSRQLLFDSREASEAMNCVAVAYAVTGRKDLRDLAVEYLEQLSHRDFGRNQSAVLGNGEYLQSFAWAYDILCPVLNESQRKAARERLDIEAQWLWVYTRTLAKITEHGWWSSSRGNNWQGVAAGGLGLAAMSLMGEDRSAELWLDEAVSQIRMLMDNGFDSDGAYIESPMYHNYAMECMIPVAQAMRRAGREDLFQYRGQLFRKTCLYKLYMMEPTRDNYASFNDGGRLAEGRALHPAAGYLLCAAEVYQDGLIAWLFDAVYGPQRRFEVWNYVHGHPDVVTWYDPRLPREDPDKSPRLTLGKYWPEHGRVALRTGWKNSDGLLFAMECGEFGSHGHEDQGGFILTAYGEHLIDDQGYGGWEATAEAHSVPLIDGRGQLHDRSILGGIRDFLHTEAIDFFEADSTPAYMLDKKPVKCVLRNVLYMRPGYFVVVDRMNKDDSPHEYQWLLQGPANDKHADIRTQSAHRATIAAQRATLDLQLLAPKDIRSQVVRKSNHIFLRVTPEKQRSEESFFSVLTPLPKGQAAPQVERIEADGLLGCRVSGDLVIYCAARQAWSCGDLSSDAEIAATRTTPAAALAKRATKLAAPGFGFTADQPVSAVLTEKEARLVCSEPATVTFSKGYLAGATIYATEQNRDPAGEKQVGKVDAEGKSKLPTGAFTIRN